MTPVQQTRLPWIVEGDPETLGMIRGTLLPMLRRSQDVDPGDPHAPSTRITRSEHGTTMEIAMTWGETPHGHGIGWSCRILVMPQCLTAIGYPCTDTMGSDAMAMLTDLIERMAAARQAPTTDDRWNTDGLPSIETANAVVTRMRERTGAPVARGERFGANRATPLATGGIRIAARPPGTNPRIADRAVLVDDSSWACGPGTIRMNGLRTISRLTGEEHRTFTFGDHGVAGETVAVDPFAMLRLEAEHPWDPRDVRIEETPE